LDRAIWRREDIGYAAAAAAAFALVVYLLAGNFGLVPSPLSSAISGDAPSLVDVAAPLTGGSDGSESPDDTVGGGRAPGPAPETPGLPVPPSNRPGSTPDNGPPSVKITTADGTTYAPTDEPRVRGTAGDAASGIDEVLVTFASEADTQTIQARVSCDDDSRRSCGWSVDASGLAGPYTVTAIARDRDGNKKNSTPIEVTILSAGGVIDEVGQGVTGDSEDSPTLLDNVGDTFGALLGH
jgi:hypothetical protein